MQASHWTLGARLEGKFTSAVPFDPLWVGIEIFKWGGKFTSNLLDTHAKL